MDHNSLTDQPFANTGASRRRANARSSRQARLTRSARPNKISPPVRPPKPSTSSINSDSLDVQGDTSQFSRYNGRSKEFHRHERLASNMSTEPVWESGETEVATHSTEDHESRSEWGTGVPPPPYSSANLNPPFLETSTISSSHENELGIVGPAKLHCFSSQEIETSTTTSPSVKQGDWECRLCDRTMLASLKSTHIASYIHQRNDEILKQEAERKEKQQRQETIQKQEEERRLEQLQKGSLKNEQNLTQSAYQPPPKDITPWECRLCDRTIFVYLKSAHLASYAHRRNGEIQKKEVELEEEKCKQERIGSHVEEERLEQLRRQEEERRFGELRKKEEERRIEELKKKEEGRRIEGLRKQEEGRRIEGFRKQEERRLEELQKKKEDKRIEDRHKEVKERLEDFREEGEEKRTSRKPQKEHGRKDEQKMVQSMFQPPMKDITPWECITCGITLKYHLKSFHLASYAHSRNEKLRDQDEQRKHEQWGLEETRRQETERKNEQTQLLKEEARIKEESQRLEGQKMQEQQQKEQAEPRRHIELKRHETQKEEEKRRREEILRQRNEPPQKVELGLAVEPNAPTVLTKETRSELFDPALGPQNRIQVTAASKNVGDTNDEYKGEIRGATLDTTKDERHMVGSKERESVKRVLLTKIWVCEVCERSMVVTAMDSHLAGKGHRVKQLIWGGERRKKEDGTWKDGEGRREVEGRKEESFQEKEWDQERRYEQEWIKEEERQTVEEKEIEERQQKLEEQRKEERRCKRDAEGQQELWEIQEIHLQEKQYKPEAEEQHEETCTAEKGYTAQNFIAPDVSRDDDVQQELPSPYINSHGQDIRQRDTVVISTPQHSTDPTQQEKAELSTTDAAVDPPVESAGQGREELVETGDVGSEGVGQDRDLSEVRIIGDSTSLEELEIYTPPPVLQIGVQESSLQHGESTKGLDEEGLRQKMLQYLLSQGELQEEKVEGNTGKVWTVEQMYQEHVVEELAWAQDVARPLPAPVSCVTDLPPILYRVYDETSVSKYTWVGFTAGNPYMPNKASSFKSMVKRHANWSSRGGTPFISVTTSPDAVGWHIAKKKAEGNCNNVMVSLIDTAVLLNTCGANIWKMHDAMDHFGIEPWKCQRRAYDNEYICALHIPARAIFACCQPDYFMDIALLFLKSLDSRE